MVSSGAMRPTAGRVLQQCRISSRSNSNRGLCLRSSSPSSSGPLVPTEPASPLLTTTNTTQPFWRQHATDASTVSRLFSTSSRVDARKTRDRSKLRGVSTIHRSGPRDFLSVTGEGIPEPVKGAGKMTVDDVDPEHGLWDFFYDKKLLPTPEEEAAHGRAWTVEELRAKSWEDLHSLWWMCVKERNRIATSNYARNKQEIGFGDYESGNRDQVVWKTMRAIKHVLTERYYAWEDAVKVAKTDPEIDLSGKGPVYTPGGHLEDEDVFESEVTEAKEGEGAGSSATGGVDPSTIHSATKTTAESSPRV